MRGRTLTEGPVLSGLLTFCGPVLLALILQALYGAVDLWAVGRFGTTADISAVSTGSQTMQMVIGGITGLSMGVTVLLGRAMGRGDSLWVFGLLGAALSLVMVLAAGPIARGMNAPAEALDQTADYIRICGGGSLCIAAYNLLSAIFRGMGDARSPLVFVAIACVVNVAGDLALIRGLGLGAAGAAMATVAAQGVSVVLSLALIRRRGLPFVIRRTHLRPDGRTAGSILLLGAPIALQDVCNEASYLILIGLVNALGVTASAGVGIAEKLVLFILLIPVAYMQSISAFTAQNLGAGQPDRAKKALWTGMATAVLLGGLAAWAAFFHGEALSMLFLHGKGGGQGGHLCGVPAFVRRLLPDGLFQRPGPDPVRHGPRAVLHLPGEDPICLVGQPPGGAGAVSDRPVHRVGGPVFPGGLPDLLPVEGKKTVIKSARRAALRALCAVLC